MLASRFIILLEKRTLVRNIPNISLWSSSVMKFSSINSTSPEDKDNLYKNQNNPLRDRSLEVFVGNLSFDAKFQDIKDFFSKCGSAYVMPQLRDKYGLKKSFVFVRFDNEKEVNDAVALDGTEFMGRKLRINKASDSENAEKARQINIKRQNEIKSNEIFVWNLPENTSEQDIRDTFAIVGAVNRVSMPKGRNNRCTAYVAFSDHNQALNACGKNFEFKGKNLKVEMASPKRN